MSPVAPASRDAGYSPAPGTGWGGARAARARARRSGSARVSRSALSEPGPVLPRRGLQMADGAFPGLVVIDLGRMAREAEGSGRLQRRHRRAGVAGVAGAVGVHRRRVGLDDVLGAMAGGAVHPGGVVIVVAGAARRHGGLGLESHPRGMTVGAGQVGVARVLEFHLPIARRLTGHRDLDRDRSRRLDLPGLVARGAVRLGRALVMADLTAPGRLESESALLR